MRRRVVWQHLANIFEESASG